MNAPEPSRVKDLSNLIVPEELDKWMCIECGDNLSLDKHKRYLPCSVCRFASCCADAFHRHVVKMHTNTDEEIEEPAVVSNHFSNNKTHPDDIRAEDFYCTKCAITNLDGNALTSHLVEECGVYMVTLRPDPQLLSAREQAEREHETMMGAEDSNLHDESKSTMVTHTEKVTNFISTVNRPSQIIEDEQYQEAEMGDVVNADDMGHNQMMIVDESDAMDQQMIDDPNTHTISIPEGIHLKPGESLVLLICENNAEEFIIINTADINTPEMQEFFTNRRSQNVYVVQSNDEIPE